MLLISRCCVGMHCRYHEKGFLRSIALRLGKQEDFIALCPEQMAGLPTPREPSSVRNGHFIGRRSGTDYTPQVMEASRNVLQICHSLGITHAYLLNNSPACGLGYGLTAEYLAANGITVHPI